MHFDARFAETDVPIDGKVGSCPKLASEHADRCNNVDQESCLIGGLCFLPKRGVRGGEFEFHLVNSPGNKTWIGEDDQKMTSMKTRGVVAPFFHRVVSARCKGMAFSRLWRRSTMKNKFRVFHHGLGVRSGPRGPLPFGRGSWRRSTPFQSRL